MINSQELYTMQNYTSRQTQMTKLWHFSNLTAYFSGDLEEEKKKSKDTKHITTPLFPCSYSDTKSSNIAWYGKLRFPSWGPTNKSNGSKGSCMATICRNHFALCVVHRVAAAGWLQQMSSCLARSRIRPANRWIAWLPSDVFVECQCASACVYGYLNVLS